jgi:hypothetical protein
MMNILDYKTHFMKTWQQESPKSELQAKINDHFKF